MGRFKAAVWSAKKRKSVKRTTDSASKFDNDTKYLLAESDKRSLYNKTDLPEGNFEEPFSVETDEESYDDEETEEIHWVKSSASLYLADPRILESNMQAATCMHPNFSICRSIFCNFEGAMISVAYQM